MNRDGHLTETVNHSLTISDLRVLVVQDGDLWFAQGVDIDYAASGASLDDVKQRFTIGLIKSVLANIERHGSAEPFLRHAPREEIARLQDNGVHKVFSVSVEAVPDLPADIPLPYNRLAFYQPNAA